MKKCWAKVLGNCGNTISREHLVSQSLFEGETINVRGLPWCKDKAKKIGLSSLTSKILCRNHNSYLSQVDEEGALAFSTFREMMRKTEVRRRINTKDPNLNEYYIDGNLLERWFLKTLINLTYNSEFPIGGDSQSPGAPSKRLVQIAYGEKEFSGKAGLYLVVREGDKITSHDRVAFAPLFLKKNFVSGGLFKFMGFRLLLFLESDGPPKRLNGVYFDKEYWGDANLSFRHETINENIDGKPSQRIHIQW